MSKFGLKCFIASFIFSLAGVFALVRTHSFWEKTSVNDSDNQTYVEAKNIELFTVDEEDDPIYEKYAQLNAQEEKGSSDRVTDENSSETEEIQTAQADGILYMPEATDGNSASIEGVGQSSEVKNQVQDQLLDDERQIAFSAESSTETEGELQIADASTASEFEIPLIHNYNESKENVSVSNQADNSQLAMASSSVSVDNLGAERKEVSQETEEYENPWVVAEVSNKNITKNKSETAFASQSTEDENKTEPQVAYKMQKNILIPIPEDIMNEKNLTPQISSSEENKRLEEELRRKKRIKSGLPPEGPEGKGFDAKRANMDSEADDDTFEDEQAEDSKSLSDSIAAWFSGTKNKKGKTVKDFFSSDKDEEKVKAKTGVEKQSSAEKNSIFRKLLGLGSIRENGDIAPAELKLSFQPDRAEISGQTLEWIHAFSDNVVNNDDVKIEIRIDRSAPFELQQKRLKLLYRILANNGVGADKVDMIFTDREPNSFIIRNVRYEQKEKTSNVVKLGDNPW